MNIRFLTPLIAALLLANPAAYAQVDYNNGVALYGQKHYAEAALAFTRAVQRDPNNSGAALYAGYSLYYAGRQAEAIDAFWQLVRRHPTRREGAQALALLKQIDRDFAKHEKGETATASASASGLAASGSSKAGSATANGPGGFAGARTGSGTASSARAGAGTAAGVGAMPRIAQKAQTAQEIIEELVTISPPKSSLPPVTPTFAKSVKVLLLDVPLPVLRFLRDNGGKVYLVPSLVEKDFRLGGTTPRGYDEGQSWNNSHAMCYGKDMVVAQYKKDRNGEFVQTNSEIGAVRHEMGHCVDHCLDYITETEDWKHAYYLDSARVPEEHRSRLSYFLQKAEGGPSETFAELCCDRFGGHTDKGRQESTELVKKYFPLCNKELDKHLAKINTQ